MVASTRPTVRDVARAAGVSPATVSRTLNGVVPVSEAVRDRVAQAIEALDYVPAAAARSLRSTMTRTVGMSLPDVRNPIFPEVMSAAAAVTEALGFSLILSIAADQDAAVERMVASRSVDGVLYVAARAAHGTPSGLKELAVPVVGFDGAPDGLDATVFRADHEHGGRVLTEHLLELGHRRIAHLAGTHGLDSVDLRRAGYLHAMAAAGIDDAATLVRYGDFTEAGGYEVTRRLLAEPERPTAIVAASDTMAIGALAAVADAGLRVPQDVAVAGFDGIDLTRYTSPRLTTYVQPVQELVELGVRHLIAVIERSDGRTVAEHVRRGELVVRDSTAPPPVRPS